MYYRKNVLMLRGLFAVGLLFTFLSVASQQIKPNSPVKKIRFVTYHKFQVDTDKSFFHQYPTAESTQKVYLIMGDYIKPLKTANGYYYVNYQNSNGKITKGWISKSDILLVDLTTRAN